MSSDQEIQVIFDKVINAGLYEPTTCYDISGKHFMCNSLKVAVTKSVITPNERLLAKDAIRGYLKTSLHTLQTFLREHNYPYKPENRLAIYKNWASRP